MDSPTGTTSRASRSGAATAGKAMNREIAISLRIMKAYFEKGRGRFQRIRIWGVPKAAMAMLLALSFTPRQQEALHYLMTAASFESPHIGEGGTRSGGYLAMRVVARAAGADAAFKDLVAHGTLAGQVYGLIGVQRT